MEDLSKVRPGKIFDLLRNVTMGLLVVVFVMSFSKVLPDFLSPAISIAGAGYLYFCLIRARVTKHDTCMMVTFSMYVSLIVYTFISILLTLFGELQLFDIPRELMFTNEPYVPSLLLLPICAAVVGVVSLQGGKLKLCQSCRAHYGESIERGRLGQILSRESTLELRNLFWLFTGLSILIWVYFLVFYININSNARDWYVFIWIAVVGIVADELYFVMRYYNLYLDLEENGELVTFEELAEDHQRTYLRVYLICGEYCYLADHLSSKYDSKHDHIDTPFTHTFYSRKVTPEEVQAYIEDHAGVSGGHLKLFYSRSYSDYMGQNMDRYFYFLDGKPDDYPDLQQPGRLWMPFEEMKRLYTERPRIFRRMLLADFIRLNNIMITSKVYNEQGERRFKLQSYRPSYTMAEVRETDMDLNSDFWIRISLENNDSASYRMRRSLRRMLGRSRKMTEVWL